MVDWILRVFADPSDIARGVSILFSSLVALLLFFLNQYFLAKRQRKAFLSNKVEFLLDKAASYTSKLTDLRIFIDSDDGGIGGDYLKTATLVSEVNVLVNEIDSVVFLYFPRFKVNMEPYFVANILPRFKCSLNHFPPSDKDYNKMLEEESEHVNTMTALLSIEIKKMALVHGYGKKLRLFSKL